jgi:MoaA/NifB/PqqE/SkfB family radical SAM enzyme
VKLDPLPYAPGPLRPAHLIIEAAQSCNLRCLTCTNWQEQHAAPELGLEERILIQKSAAAAGVRRLTYLGAEPFMNPKLLTLAAHAKEAGLHTMVVTNGTLLDQEICDEIVRRLLFDDIVVSIDGPRELHDRIRGVTGTFERASQGISTLRPKLSIYVTVSALNCEILEDIFAVAQQLDPNALRFTSISCLDSGLVQNTNALFDRPVLQRHSYLIDAALRIPPAKRPFVREQLERISETARSCGIQLHTEEFLFNARGASHCAFLGETLVVTARGEVCLCPMLPQYCIGSVRDSPLAELLSSRFTRESLSHLRQLQIAGSLPVCTQCCVEKLARGA